MVSAQGQCRAPGVIQQFKNLFLLSVKFVCMKVKAAEIVNSDVYAVGYTLRFPRVETARVDKDWSNCMTVQVLVVIVVVEVIEGLRGLEQLDDCSGIL